MSDLISRSTLIEKIVNTPTESLGYITVYLDGCATRQNEIIDIINELPSVEPVRGEWIKTPGMFLNECSICHTTHKFASCAKFCPNCGADMRKKVTK